jgi:RNA polymerase sigma-70 factor (ECF subfamily)
MIETMKTNERERIFDEWLEQHKGLFFKVIRAYAFNPQDQEDLFQEIATQVWNSIPKFRGESAVTTWIYRVALYSAIAWSKKERQHREKKRTYKGSNSPLLKASEDKNPRLDWLYEQILKLDEIDRSLTLLMLDGLSYKEISETLGITESNVGVKLNRIKKRFTEQSHKELNNGF